MKKETFAVELLWKKYSDVNSCLPKSFYLSLDISVPKHLDVKTSWRHTVSRPGKWFEFITTCGTYFVSIPILGTVKKVGIMMRAKQYTIQLVSSMLIFCTQKLFQLLEQKL